MNNNLIKIESEEFEISLANLREISKTVGEIITGADLKNARSVIGVKKDLKAGIKSTDRKIKDSLNSMKKELKVKVDEANLKVDEACESAQKRLNYYNMKLREAKEKKEAERLAELEKREAEVRTAQRMLKIKKEEREAEKKSTQDKFKKQELENNEYISQKVDDWSQRINPKCMGDIDENHIGVIAGNITADEEFKKKLKTGWVLIEDVLNRFCATNSLSTSVAKSKARHKIKEMDGKRFLIIQIELDEKNKGF